MSKSIKKILASTLAVAMVAGSLAASTGGAQAKPFPKWGWGGGYGYGLGAAGLIGGMALGAAIASEASCGYVRQRVYDDYGRFIGFRRVSTC